MVSKAADKSSNTKAVDSPLDNDKQVISTLKFGYPCLTSKGQKVKSEHIRRFLAHDFLQNGFTLQTSMSYKHFKVWLSLFELEGGGGGGGGANVRSEDIRRFPVHDFL